MVSSSFVGIVSAFRAQLGEQVFKFVGREGYCWFTASELVESEKAVRSRITTQTGELLATPSDLRPYVTQAQEWRDFDNGILAKRPGWHGEVFALGDGRFLPQSTDNCVSTFEPARKFQPSGTLREWKSELAPLVSGQTLPMVALAFGLVGPLLRFVPRDFMPPQLELYGKGSSGKTTLGVLAASVWAGDPDSDVGGGETYQTTPNAVDNARHQHADMLLYEDDATSTPGSTADRIQMRFAIAMTVSSTRLKKRHGDKPDSEVIRVPRLSSANAPLFQLVADLDTAERDAMLQRMMFINVEQKAAEGSVTIFDELPPLWKDSAEATSALRVAATKTYGLAGPALVEYLVGEIAAVGFPATEAEINRLCQAALARLVSLRTSAPLRHLKMLALLQIALEIGMRSGVLDRSWGDPTGIVDQLRCVLRQAAPTEDLPDLLKRLVDEKCGKAEGRILKWGVPYIPFPQRPKNWWGMLHRTPSNALLYLDRGALEQLGWSNGLSKIAKKQGFLLTHTSEGNRLTMKAPRPMAKLGFGRVQVFDVTSWFKD